MEVRHEDVSHSSFRSFALSWLLSVCLAWMPEYFSHTSTQGSSCCEIDIVSYRCETETHIFQLVIARFWWNVCLNAIKSFCIHLSDLGEDSQSVKYFFLKQIKNPLLWYQITAGINVSVVGHYCLLLESSCLSLRDRDDSRGFTQHDRKSHTRTIKHAEDSGDYWPLWSGIINCNAWPWRICSTFASLFSHCSV